MCARCGLPSHSLVLAFVCCVTDWMLHAGLDPASRGWGPVISAKAGMTGSYTESQFALVSKGDKRKMSEEEFVRLADRLAREERFANSIFPVMLRHRDGGGHPFPCIHADRDALLAALEQKEPQRRNDNVRVEPIDDGRMYVAVPRTANYRLQRAEQLLEACGLPLYHLRRET